jgi:death-on-curing protein
VKTVYLSSAAVLFLHERLMGEFGGSPGIRDEGAVLAALARPHATFDGQPLYPGLFEKGAALLESLCVNHPFIDGNKRVAFAGTGLFLELNGWRLKASPDEAESFILSVAAGQAGKEEIRIWLEAHSSPIRNRKRR